MCFGFGLVGERVLERKSSHLYMRIFFCFVSGYVTTIVSATAVEGQVEDDNWGEAL